MTKSTISTTFNICLCFLLMGCASSNEPDFIIDNQTYQSVGKNERISTIILHYTAEINADSLYKLTHADVSAHYLIPDTQDNIIYNLVPEHQRAWHAGRGEFAGRNHLNDTSIGIEIVNEGIAHEFRGSDTLRQLGLTHHPYNHYVAYNDIQIQKIAYLLQDLVQRYDIKPQNIIAHSDMAPSRKIDPGAKFPWERLYTDYGIGAWYNEADKAEFLNQSEFEEHSISDIKQMFRDYGYAINDTNEWDSASRNVIYAFQLHFMPHHLTAEMDLQTYATLRALNKKYGNE